MFYIFVKHFLFLFLFLTFGYVIGRVFLKDFVFYSISENLALSLASGWAIIVFLITSLGFLGGLSLFVLFPSLIIVFVSCLIIATRNGYFQFNHLFLFFKNKSFPFFIILGFPTLLYFILLFYLSAYPITEWDAISYHLPVAKEFISQGKIVPTPFLRFPVHPQLIEMFFVLALMFKNSLFANLTQYAMAIVLVILIYSFAQRYINRDVGLFSAFVFLSSPIVSKFTVVPYVEVGTTLFCFSAFYAMFIWVNEKKLSYAMLSAIFWGLAFGSKYYAILFFLIVFLATIIIFGRQIRLAHLAPILIIMLLIAFPWYLRNKAYSGDWFFPLFLDRVSGPSVWGLVDFKSQMAQMCSLGIGTGIKSLFMLPINLFCHADRLGGNIGPFIMLSLGSFLFVRKWPHFITAFMIIITVYSFIWFYNFQEVRYLFPILPILSILTGWTLNNVNFYLGFKSCQFWGGLIIAVLILGCVNCAKIIREKGKISITNTEEFEYLSKVIPTYKAINFLNNIKQEDTIVYALFDEGSVFYHKNKVIGDWFGPAAYRNVWSYINKPVLLHETLKYYGAQYLLINKRKVQEIVYILEGDLFKLVYSDQNALIFEVL